MTQQVTPAAPVAPTVAPDAQPTAAAQPTTTAPVTEGSEPQTFDLTYVQNLRKEAAGYRTKLRAMEEAQQAAEQAKLGDLEKATKQLETLSKRAMELETTLRSERIRWAVEKAATRLNLDPDLAASLVKESEIELDDAGHPTNPEKHLKALLQKWPQLAKREPAPPSINADQGRGQAPAVAPDRDAEIKRRFRIT